jgi:hypothetical protein
MVKEDEEAQEAPEGHQEGAGVPQNTKPNVCFHEYMLFVLFTVPLPCLY